MLSTSISFNPHNHPALWGNWQSAFRLILPPNSSDDSTPQISFHYYPPTHCDTIINLHGRLNKNPSKYSHSNRRLEESNNNKLIKLLCTFDQVKIKHVEFMSQCLAENKCSQISYYYFTHSCLNMTYMYT